MGREPISMPDRPPMGPMAEPFITPYDPEANVGTDTATVLGMEDGSRLGEAGKWTLLAAGGAAAISASAWELNNIFNKGTHNKLAAPGQTSSSSAMQAYDACVDGMFPSGVFENSEKADTSKSFLHLQPNKDLPVKGTDNKPSPQALLDYFFGKSSTDVAGNDCHTVLPLSAQAAITVDIKGVRDEANHTGANPLKANSTNPNKVAENYINNKDHKDAAADVDKLANYLSRAELNSQVVQTDLYRVVTDKVSDDVNNSDPWMIKVVREHVNFAPGTVYILDGRDFQDGDEALADENQRVYFNAQKDNGQIYLEKQAGFELKQVDEGAAAVNNTQGGGQFGTANGNGESNQPGNVPESGGNGGSQPGEAPSFGPGSPNTTPGSPNTTPGTPNTTPNTTPTTQPATTTTQPATTTTQPATTTTQPTTTTPDTKGTVPCDPNIANCDNVAMVSPARAEVNGFGVGGFEAVIVTLPLAAAALVKLAKNRGFAAIKKG